MRLTQRYKRSNMVSEGFLYFPKHWLFLLVVFFLYFPPSIVQAAETIQTVRVGITPFTGYYQISAHGDRSGYGYELLQIMARHANLKYEYVDNVPHWDDLEQMLLDGRLDLLTCVQKTPENEARFAFSQDAIGTSYTLVTVKAGNTAITPGDYRSFAGRRVGVLHENSHAQKFAAFAATAGFTYTQVEYTKLSDMLAALQQGQIDLLVSSNLRQIHDEWIVEQFSPSPYFLMFRKDDQVLQEKLARAVKNLDTDSPNWRSELFNHYYTPVSGSSLQLTPLERQYLAQLGQKVLRVTVCPDNAPYSYLENGQIRGIIPDIFEEIAKRAGIKYQVIQGRSHVAYHDLLQQDKTDIIMDYGWSYSQAEKAGYKLTIPYIIIPVTQVTRIGFNGDIKTVAVPEGNILFALLRSSLAQKYQLQTYNSVIDTMTAVTTGKSDAAFVYNEDAQNYLANDIHHGLRVTLLPNLKIATSVALSAKEDYLLLSILNKSAESVRGDFVNNIVLKYTADFHPHIGIVDYLYLNPSWGLAALLVTVLLVLALIIIIYQRVWYKRQRLLTEQMEQAKLEADRANQAKSVFLSSMSHDLRTPLNAILGFTDLALQDKDQIARQQYLDRIKLSGNLLLALVNDTLDLSRIESGKLKLDLEPVVLVQMLQELLAAVRPSAEQKGVKLLVDIAKLSDASVLVDRLKLQKIILNLLFNAVKFTPSGGTVQVTATKLQTPTAGMTYRFEVADNGIGISKDFLQHLFEPFSQELRPEVKNVVGTGLGLAIVQKSIEAMGGTINVQSDMGAGTKFTFYLPLQETATPVAKVQPVTLGAQASASLQGKVALLCEDNALNTEITTLLLQKRGMKVDSAVNGKAGLEKFQAAPLGYYAVIIMDIRMPVMNGYEATRAVRNLSRSDAKTIPIIAMTADVFAEDIKVALDSGMNGYVSKPVIPEQLFAELHKYCD